MIKRLCIIYIVSDVGFFKSLDVSLSFFIIYMFEDILFKERSVSSKCFVPSL